MNWPATPDELSAAGYRGQRWATCTCGARILWAFTPQGKRMPMELAPAPDGQPGVAMRVVTVDGDQAQLAPLFQTHFASCPDAGRHRRRRT